MRHPFFFNALNWTGEGMVRFENSSLAYPYTATWDIKPDCSDVIRCTQLLTLSEVEVVYRIDIEFSNITNETFSLSFDNSEYGVLAGQGSWDNNFVEWKLFDSDKVKIFDAIYEKEKPELYHVKNTLLLKNGDILLIDGVLQTPVTVKN